MRHTRIYSAIKSKCPGVEVTHFAHGSHLKPPESEHPLEGMTITVSFWGRDLSVPIADERTRPEYRESLKQWLDILHSSSWSCILHAKYARHMCLGVHTLPMPNIADEMRNLKSDGFDGLELPMAYMGRWVKGLNIYVLSRLMWDTHSDTETIIDDYFQKYYGVLSGKMHEAFDRMERAHADWRYWVNNYAGDSDVKVPNPFPEELVSHARQIIQACGEVKQILGECKSSLEKIKADQGIGVAHTMGERVGYLATCIDYWSLEWRGLISLAKGAQFALEAKSAETAEKRQDLLGKARKELQDAGILDEERKALAAETTNLAMHWDVTGDGPSRVFYSDRVKEWLDYISEIGAAE